MSWDAAMLEEQAVTGLKADYQPDAGRALTAARQRHKPFASSVMFSRGFTEGYFEGAAMVLRRQRDWESLTAGESILELRKGPGSIYFPLFSENPAINADCPGRGGHRTVVDAEGVCPECGYDFETEM